MDQQGIPATLLDAWLREPEQRRHLLREFQKIVWESARSGSDDPEWDVYRELAYDLDFFEPDPSHRAEDPSFYGEERAEEEVRCALEKLKALGVWPVSSGQESAPRSGQLSIRTLR